MKELGKLIEEARNNPEVKEDIINHGLPDCDRAR